LNRPAFTNAGYLGGTVLETFETLLAMYDERQISRRQLMGALLMTSAAAPLAVETAQPAAAPPSGNLTGTPAPPNALFRGRILNHVTLNVHNLDASRRFYQELLGASVLRDGRLSGDRGWYDLRIGDSFISVSKGKDVAIDHFAVGLDPWPGVDRALEMTQKRFPASEARLNLNPVTKSTSVSLKDPNGLSVQLGSVTYEL
jgi:catechol 2,3-dioxygenase-like lactoylglutathione lyase family enzyme